jgi:hypothetical protein
MVVRGGAAVSNAVPSRSLKVVKIALFRQESKQILRKSNLQSALRQAAPPNLVGCSRHAKKKTAFDKYVLSPSSYTTIDRLRYGENSAPRKDPEKFRATLPNCGWFEKFAGGSGDRIPVLSRPAMWCARLVGGWIPVRENWPSFGGGVKKFCSGPKR